MLTQLDIVQSQDLLTELEKALTERLLPLQEMGLGVINSPVQPQARMWGNALIYFTNLDSEQPKANTKLTTSTAIFTIAVKIEEMRTHQTSYPFLMEIRDLLQGFQPGYTKKTYSVAYFYLQNISYSPYAEGEGLAWTYDMSFAIRLSH